jgi:hypothetical protein
MKSIKTIFKTTIAIFAIATSLISCSKDDDAAPAAPEKTVYIAGYEKITGKQYATIWKNGVAAILTDGTKSAEALKVVVSGSDVYVLGKDGADYKVWKNGTPLYTLVSCTVAEGLYVSGNDVYVSGNYDNFAKYWKNNTQENISDGVYPCRGRDIILVNNIVHVVGEEIKSIAVRIAKLWKRGSAPESIDLSPADKVDTANNIFYNGTNVYISGTVGYYGKIWKDEISSFTTPNTGSLFSVFCSENDVYALGSGFETYGTQIYKNKNSIALPNNFDGKSIFVSETDIYVLGSFETGSNEQPALSKNGTVTKFGDDSGRIQMKSIFVVK